MAEQEMMRETQVNAAEKPEVESEKELQLIQELVSLRKESDRSLEYESLDGYRKPPGTHFAMLKKPSVSIRYGRMTFNMAAVRMFEGTVNIVPMLHEGKRRLAVIPCKEEESESVEWARYTKKGKWSNKDVRSDEFVNSIFDIMGWDPTCRYKVQGRLANSDRGLILVFDLNVCICYEKGKESYTDPVTGKTKQRQIMHHIDNFGGHIGMPYNDYEAARKLNQFEDIGGYVGSESDGAATEQSAADARQYSDDSMPGSPQEQVVLSSAPQQMTFTGSVYSPAGNTMPDDSQNQYGEEYYRAVGNE